MRKGTTSAIAHHGARALASGDARLGLAWGPGPSAWGPPPYFSSYLPGRHRLGTLGVYGEVTILASCLRAPHPGAGCCPHAGGWGA